MNKATKILLSTFLAIIGMIVVKVLISGKEDLLPAPIATPVAKPVTPKIPAPVAKAAPAVIDIHAESEALVIEQSPALELPETPLSPYFQKLSALGENPGLDSFLKVYKITGMIKPFFPLESTSILGLGPQTTLFEGSTKEGEDQMLVFVTEGKPDYKLIYNFTGVHSESLETTKGLTTATDKGGESFFIIETKSVNDLSVTGIWKKQTSKHSDTEKKSFQNSIP